MAELLSYRPSDSAVYYKPPKKFAAGRLIAALVFCVATALAAAWIYAYFLPPIRNLLLRMSACVGFAVSIGVISGLTVRHGKVRSQLVAACVGAVASVVAGYCMWLFWVHHFFVSSGSSVTLRLLISHPSLLLRIAHAFKISGTWMYNADPVQGGPLLGIWFCESAVLFAAGILLPISMVLKDDPVCECGTQVKRAPGLPAFAVDRQSEFLTAVESRQFDQLATHAAPIYEDAPELKLTLASCPSCAKTHVLSVNRVEWALNSRTGKFSVRRTPLVSQMLLPTDVVAEFLQTCLQINAHREQAASTETPRQTATGSGQEEGPREPDACL